EATNVVLVGPNGIGKTLLAKNIAHQAVIHGHSVLFTTAGQLLGDLAALDSDSALRRRVATMHARDSWSSMRSAISPTPIVIPPSCPSSSVAAMSKPAPSSPPIGPSPSGARSSPMLPVSSPSSTALSITPRFSPSMVDPTASKKPKNAPNSGHASAAEASHDSFSFNPTAPHHSLRHPRVVDARADSRSRRAAR